MFVIRFVVFCCGTVVELLAYYRHEVLSINPSSITAVKAAAKYDASTSFDENMANHLAIIAAV